MPSLEVGGLSVGGEREREKKKRLLANRNLLYTVSEDC